MELNLPIFNQLAACRNLLIAGMGGGYDVFCGLPLYFALQARGQNVHLASFSFSDIEHLRHGVRLSPTLVGVTANPNLLYPYCPELQLANWFDAKRHAAVPIWSFQKTGAAPLLANYHLLVDHLAIDGILLVDGGVDSLMTGDEVQMGTVVEDATSLFAVHALNHIPTRLMACIGFGAEQDVAYAHVFENIAALTKAGGFLGACALAPQMAAYRAYEDALLYVQGQPYQDSSVINSSIVSAVRGEYGDYHLTDKTRNSRLWISPLMSLYWFFALTAVAERNVFLSQLADTYTFRDALHQVLSVTQHLRQRPPAQVPL